MIQSRKINKMLTIAFEKMHGIGNDFVLIDNRNLGIKLTPKQIVHMANRHMGIGFDQLLLLNQSSLAGCDASYQFYNPDGSQAEQCGNGQRCLSLYLHQQKQYQNQHQTSFKLSGLAGVISSEILPDNKVRVNMGRMKSYQAKTINGQRCYELDFGNPHLVTEVKDVKACDLSHMNQSFTKSYSNGINFELVQIISPEKIAIRVHERGTGETLACGSGACAAVFALIQAGDLKSEVKVMLPGGNLMVEYNQQNKTIYLTGPAQSVFTGEISI